MTYIRNPAVLAFFIVLLAILFSGFLFLGTETSALENGIVLTEPQTVGHLAGPEGVSGSKGIVAGACDSGAVCSCGVSSHSCVTDDKGDITCTDICNSCAVAGSCGGAETNYVYDASGYSGSFCSAGSASPSSPAFPSQGGSTPWSCSGSGGGTSASCTATRNIAPQCDNDISDDLDGLIDEDDPGCHTDGDPTNSSSYDPNDDDETDEPLPSATVSITANPSVVPAGTKSLITWSANNVTSCSVSVVPGGLFDGPIFVVDPAVNIPPQEKLTGPVTTEQTYILVCQPSGVDSTDVATVKVLPFTIIEI